MIACRSPRPAKLIASLGTAQLEQLIVNLTGNASDAVASGGRVRIAAQNVYVTALTSVFGGILGPGEFVVIKVSDNGPGIAASDAARIFEPFYSTKRSTHNTGLGLAVVHGIVVAAGGGIDLETALGEGTTFSIYIPRFNASGAPAHGANVGLSRKETVLVVEDQDAVLRVMVRQLERAGYNVLAANIPERAIETARAHGGPIHLLVSDVNMPMVSGPELAQRLSELHPEMRILFVSGYPEDILTKHALADGHFLSKPFRSETLLEKIGAVLAEPAPSHGGIA